MKVNNRTYKIRSLTILTGKTITGNISLTVVINGGKNQYNKH